jgi:hypothetical protein
VLRGYPAVELLGSDGSPLPLHTQQGGGFFPDSTAPATTVTISPGVGAQIGISFVTNDEYAGDRICRRSAAVLLRLPSPADSRWQRVSLPRQPTISPCGDQLVISPIHA